MQEQWQVELDGEIELGLKELQLRGLVAEEEPVVVESDLAEGDGEAFGVRGTGECAESGEEGGGAARLGCEGLRVAGVHADGGEAGAGCAWALVGTRTWIEARQQ